MAITEITPNEAKAIINARQDVVLLDVRTQEEYELARVEGAVLIPMHELQSRVEELDPDRPTIVMCHHGMRSYQVALFLQSLDFPEVANLAGGIERWSVEVDPSVPRY